MHEITAGHRSLSGTISCVTERIRFLPVTMTGRFSNFNSTLYTEDRHELRVTGRKCRLPDSMSGTGEIFISGTASRSHSFACYRIFGHCWVCRLLSCHYYRSFRNTASAIIISGRTSTGSCFTIFIEATIICCC